jgi:hypothetical protein
VHLRTLIGYKTGTAPYDNYYAIYSVGVKEKKKRVPSKELKTNKK